MSKSYKADIEDVYEDHVKDIRNKHKEEKNLREIRQTKRSIQNDIPSENK